MKKQPRIPIAPPQTGDQEGTWAYYTLGNRFADTIQRVILENDFPKNILERLEKLLDEVPNSPLRLLQDPAAPDRFAWKEYITPYLGLNWRQPPWFTSEHYFYRRILEATGYFEIGEGFKVDPFLYQKTKGVDVSREVIVQALREIRNWQDTGLGKSDIIRRLLFLNLWGNQADLSLWPADGESKPDHKNQKQASEYVIIDNAKFVVSLLCNESPQRVDFLVDNAGFELVTDLIFADYLLKNDIVAKVQFHLKMHPTYVSDATKNDVDRTLDQLRKMPDDNVQSIGSRLQAGIEDGRFVLLTDWFWTSPLDGWEMPDYLRNELASSNLVISKGDAHYRRLLGDRHWSYDDRFEDILAYFPTTVVALRTLKSELIVGLSLEQVAEIEAKDPNWMINGRWGLVQFRKPGE